jgi:hypothetical protein
MDHKLYEIIFDINKYHSLLFDQTEGEVSETLNPLERYDHLDVLIDNGYSFPLVNREPVSGKKRKRAVTRTLISAVHEVMDRVTNAEEIDEPHSTETSSAMTALANSSSAAAIEGGEGAAKPTREQIKATTLMDEPPKAVSKKVVAKKVTLSSDESDIESFSDESDVESFSDESDDESSSNESDAKLSEPPEATESLSEYERLRQDRIARNRAWAW